MILRKTCLTMWSGAPEGVFLEMKLRFSVTFGKRPNDDQRTVLVMSGETVGSSGRRQSGLSGLAPQVVSSSRRNPIKWQIDQWINTSRGSWEERRMRSPTGWILYYRPWTLNKLQELNPLAARNAKFWGLLGSTRPEWESVTAHWTSTWWDAGGAQPGFTSQSPVSPCASLSQSLYRITKHTNKMAASKQHGGMAEIWQWHVWNTTSNI